MDKRGNVRNFLILGTQRTGSQALYVALNLHPEVVCGGEWTFKSHWYEKISKAEEALSGDFQQFIVGRPHLQARYAGALTDSTRWLGFKILFRSSAKWIGSPALAPALWVDRLEGHIRWLRRSPDIHVIQLIRRNPIEWLKSKYLGRVFGNTHKTYSEGFKIRIPIGSGVRAIMAKRRVDERIASLADTNPYHRLYYEDFLADNLKELERCLAFLDCDSSRLPADGPCYKRQSKGDASDYIENYVELVAALQSKGAWPIQTALGP